jgi:hypothetical protein
MLNIQILLSGNIQAISTVLKAETDIINSIAVSPINIIMWCHTVSESLSWDTDNITLWDQSHTVSESLSWYWQYQYQLSDSDTVWLWSHRVILSVST